MNTRTGALVPGRFQLLVLYGRHLLVAMLLFAAWRFLEAWYYSWHAWDLVAFGACCAGAIFLTPLFSLKESWKIVSRGRKAVLLCFLIFLFPWGECLRLNAPRWREDWTRQLFFQSLILYAFLFLFRLLPKQTTLLRQKIKGVLRFLSSTSFLLMLPSILFFLFSAWIALFHFRKIPMVQDSAAHLFQAKIFLTGRLAAPAPPASEFFSFKSDMLVMRFGRWFCTYPPGYPLLLAAAMLLHSEWLLGPVLGASTLAIWTAYIRKWHNSTSAALFAWIALFSPFLLLMSSTIMIHTPELFLASAAIYLCRKQTEDSSRFSGILLLAVLFTAVAVRGFSLLPFLAPILLYTGAHFIRRRKWGIPAGILLALAAGIVVVCLYQWKTTGSPWLPAYRLEYPDWKYGFGSTYSERLHTPARGMENTSNNLLAVNRWLTGWYSGSLFFILLFLVTEPKVDRWDKLLFWACGVLALFYFFVVVQDLVFGPRFYYLMAPVLLLAIARAAGVGEKEDGRASWAAPLLVISLVISVPLSLPAFIRNYTPRSSLKEAINQLGNSRTLLFLTREVPQHYVNWNDPFLRENVVIVRDMGDRNSQAIASFPGYRSAYFQLNVSLDKLSRKGGYSFSYRREQEPAGYISFFRTGLAILSATGTDRDFFDVCYSGPFALPGSADRLRYLETVEKHKANEPRLTEAMLHLARLLLLPAVDFEQHGASWDKYLDYEGFRKEYVLAREELYKAGETGKPLAAELEKAAIRIDQNSDGYLADAEIRRFLSGKIEILRID